ncbi:hypothetical protein HPB47_012918 [Ixodes persulcatus]|uniref:Uncharacterized protein n=1 Tax=Ixodes persulcatus TaxID=34615 RepID=A0AC60NS64_IXOPE|nr:hypothetical protein HPB47_012918 [Ixodes persulcatus]
MNNDGVKGLIGGLWSLEVMFPKSVVDSRTDILSRFLLVAAKFATGVVFSCRIRLVRMCQTDIEKEEVVLFALKKKKTIQIHEFMEYFLEKLRMSRSVKDDQISIESKQAKNDRRPTKIFNSQLQYPSPTFIDKVLLSRSLKVKRTEGEGIAEFSNSEFVQQCLRTHNELRLRHEVPPLQLCYKLCDLAQYWANHLAHTDDFYYRKFRDVGENLLCRWSYVPDFDITGEQLCDLAQYWANHLAHTDDFYYRKFRDVGENLLCRWSYVPDFDITGEQVARYWYSESKYYDFFLDPSILHVQAGHFSQMVWRSSSDFGVGKARTRCGKIIVVAMYKPAGNVLGEFQSNVLPHPLPADSASPPQASASSSST